MKALGRLYIRPMWLGRPEGLGEAKMAYDVTAAFGVGRSWAHDRRLGFVEFSVTNPAMENRWTFSRLDVAEVIRQSFREFIARKRFERYLLEKRPT